MTTYKNPRQRNRDVQDGFERHAYSRLEHTDTGAIVTVKGTGTEDVEAPVLNSGYGFALDDDAPAEVFLLSGGSDTGLKFALPTLPRDKQRKWEKNHGGVQNPVDPSKAIDFGPDGVHITEGTVFLGPDKKIKITISGDNLTIETGGNVDFKCDRLTHNGVNIGDSHKHGGVERGGELTLEPQ